ncbi:CBR-TAG protein [Ditylenchus destructor]|nr:CBR-TAG protein [Ditylenchus destructor]
MNTPLHFAPMYGRPDIARVNLLLSNNTDRPVHYKLKCSTGSNVTALPSSTGEVLAKSTKRIALTLRRPEPTVTWADMEKPKMLLLTSFDFEDPELKNCDVTSTRLIGVVLQSKKGRTETPTEQLVLNADKVETRENPEVNVARIKSEVDTPFANQYDEMSSPSILIIILIAFLLLIILVRNAYQPLPTREKMQEI